MKKALKIILIVIASLLAVLIIGVSTALWFVFTPDKLTPIVREQAGQLVTCRSKVGSVELTFFSTFPNFGLKIKDLKLINPMPGAPSDTLLMVDEVVANVDVSAWWKNKDVVLSRLRLNNVVLNAYIDSKGKSNFNVIAPSKEEREKDTTSVMDLFHSARLDKITLDNVKLSYIDEQNKIKAQVNNLKSELTASISNDCLKAVLDMKMTGLSFGYDGESYLKDAALNLKVPFGLVLSGQSLALHKAEIDLNGFKVVLDGSARNNVAKGDINADLTYSLDKWQIKKALAMVPSRFGSMLQGVDADGILTLGGSVSGTFGDKSMPLVTARLILEGGKVKYDGFPLALHDIHGDISLQTDFKTDSLSSVRILALGAKTARSEIGVTGDVSNVLSDMLCNLKTDLKISLPEFAPMIPKDMKMNVAGVANGSVSGKFKLSQLEKKDFAGMHIQGRMALADVKVDYDTLNVDLDKASVNFSIPNTSRQANKENRFLQLTLLCENLLLNQGKSVTANVRGTNLKVAASDILKTNSINSIDCNFAFDALNATMDGKTSVDIVRPIGNVGMCGYLNNMNVIPALTCSFAMDDLSAIMDTISVHVKKPDGKVSLQASKQDSKQPELRLDYRNESLVAQMGKQKVRTGAVDVSTDVVYDKTQKNILLQWIPTGSVSLENGWLSMAGVRGGIRIPVVKCDFSPEKYIVKDSRMVIGRSDFQLFGELKNVTSYLRGDSLLAGDFKFNSASTDIASLMNLTSGIGDKEEQKTVPEDTTEMSSGPFMVPKGISLNLETHIDRAFFKNDTARNIRGKVLLNDGALMLENMNFVTDAAKMQLTALYKSPRKNHLYVGLDYHMMDVEISELLAMIPDIDSIMPMLRSFGGKGEFHMAIETNMDSLYQLKKSTLLGAASIKGEDLILMDGETFGEIAKMLRFNKKTRNKVDSLSAEFTIFQEEVDVYPFLIVMDKYKAVVGGRHNLDMSFNYNISLIDSPLPIRLGLDVYGTLDKMHFKLAKCKYSRLYRPAARKAVDASQLRLKDLIRDALIRRVKE